MDFIADIFLAVGAFGAAIYCWVLGRRLKRFNDLEKGVGGAVAVLSAQVDDLTRTLSAAQSTAAKSSQDLTELTRRAEEMSRRLELQMASLHDIPQTPEAEPPETEEVLPDTEPPKVKAGPMFRRHVTTEVPA